MEFTKIRQNDAMSVKHKEAIMVFLRPHTSEMGPQIKILNAWPIKNNASDCCTTDVSVTKDFVIAGSEGNSISFNDMDPMMVKQRAAKTL